MAINPNVIDVEFEIFWKDVGQAVRMIELKPAEFSEISVERGTRGALVKEYQGRIAIMMFEVEPKQPTLLNVET